MSETKPYILIIDDDASTLEMMRMILEEENRYRVTTTESIFENVTEVERLHPQLILLDFLMQGRQSGWTLL
jgi:CheY-like chemotaxis protein